MPPKSRPDAPRWSRRWIWKCGLLLCLVVAFLAGLIGAGHWALDYLRGRERYDVSFHDIECVPPPGLSKQEFLDEVLYESRLPQRLNLVDEGLPERLREAFLQHAWVENADVEIRPPRQIVVTLKHRTPVLAVKVGETLRAVDGAGVLLPRNAPTRDLPIYDGAAPAPRGDGQRWGDSNVEAAARKLRK